MTEPTAPLYVRVLRLRQLRLGGLACFLLFEGVIGLSILLALAEFVSWWGILALPAAVAAMVKINDVVIGLVRPDRPAAHRAVPGPPPYPPGSAPYPPLGVPYPPVSAPYPPVGAPPVSVGAPTPVAPQPVPPLPVAPELVPPGLATASLAAPPAVPAPGSLPPAGYPPVVYQPAAVPWPDPAVPVVVSPPSSEPVPRVPAPTLPAARIPVEVVLEATRSVVAARPPVPPTMLVPGTAGDPPAGSEPVVVARGRARVPMPPARGVVPLAQVLQAQALGGAGVVEAQPAALGPSRSATAAPPDTGEASSDLAGDGEVTVRGAGGGRNERRFDAVAPR